MNGCINDVKNVGRFLNKTYNIKSVIYSDDKDIFETTKYGMTMKLYELAVDSYRNNLDYIYIHYSGHGSNIRDENKDEPDGYDEVLVPSDYRISGGISDDDIHKIFNCFNPKTKILCVFDCCYSGSIADLKYRWLDTKQVSLENIACNIEAKIISLSGCRDDQTSADALINGNYAGALSNSMLSVLNETPSVFSNCFLLLEKVRKQLKQDGYEQVPQICSSFNLLRDPTFMPNS